MNAIHSLSPTTSRASLRAAPRPIRAAWIVLALFSLALAPACGDSGPAGDSDAADATGTSDVDELLGKSVYRLETTFNDQPIVLDRDLTGGSQYFAFGSTHIAPAVSFAMTDSVTFPRTMSITLNFGIVVPSDTLPVQTDSARAYAFSASPPAVKVSIGGLQYSSQVQGATGQIDVTRWSTESGAPVAGTFSGTLVAEGASDRTLPVAGTFYFTLPAKNDGQPR